MPEYAYTARDRTGRVVEGTITADNSALASGRIRQMGLEVEKVRAVERPRGYIEQPQIAGAAPRDISIAQRFSENFILPVVSGVPLKDLAVFYRQFATMIRAGIPLYQSIVTLEGQTRNPKLQGILRDCQAQVQLGGKLSDVFAAYPWVFNELQIEMIRAAEHGGLMDEMLQRIADYLEREIALRRLISRLTLYPKIVVIVAWFILGVRFFVDFTPAFSKLIIGMMKPEINYTTTDYFMDTAVALAIVLLIIFGIVAFCRIVLFQSEAAQESYERFKMSLPGLGTAVRAFALAKFGRAFGAMYAAGMPLNTAIRVAGNASGSKTIARATRRALVAVDRGAVLSLAFRETGVFPNMVIDMLHTGEQTGNVDAMMEKSAEYLENEAESRAHVNAHIFAASVGLIVAVFIGYAVIRFYGQLGSSYLGAINDAGKP